MKYNVGISQSDYAFTQQAKCFILRHLCPLVTKILEKNQLDAITKIAEPVSSEEAPIRNSNMSQQMALENCF